MENPVSVSVAIPLYNEESVLPLLLQRTRAVLDALPGDSHEIVCVDDGSSDRTFQLLKQAVEEDPRIVAISLSRNFGQQAAFCAAMEHTMGDVVVLMDGDLQDPPETIPRMLELYHQGYDVVYAIRVKRKEGIVLRACYYLFYRLMASLAEITLPQGAGDFSLMSRRVIDQLNTTPERQRYLRGLRTWFGYRQIGIDVERSARAASTPKYTLRQLMRLALDGIFSFSLLPMRAATVLGAVIVSLSALYVIAIIFTKLFYNESPQGFTTLVVSIMFFAGLQLLFLGIIGEYIGRIYREVKARPLFVLKQIVRKSS